MELYIIDFDKQFKRYLNDWLQKNKDNYQALDEIEEVVPELYEKWSDAPAKWLDGVKPNEYFKQFDDSTMLIKLMVRYSGSHIGIPNALLDRISELKDKSLQPLADLFLLKVTLPKKVDVNETRLLAANLINEIDSAYLSDEYIETLKDKNLDEGLADVLCEALSHNINKIIVEKIFTIMDNVTYPVVLERYADIISNFPGNDGVFQRLLELFIKSRDHKAIFASYLGKYGDERAIVSLEEALNLADINYLDYLEIRNAIEALGGEVRNERSFENDPYYESLKGVE